MGTHTAVLERLKRKTECSFCGNGPLRRDDRPTGLCRCCREGHFFTHDINNCWRCRASREEARWQEVLRVMMAFWGWV